MHHRLLFTAFFLACLPACGGSADCNLTTIAPTLAGAGATDCGYVALGEDAAKADACAVAAFQAGQAFFEVWEEQGIDSAVSSAIVFDGTTVVTLSRDSNPSGGGNTGAVVNEAVCGSPAVVPGKDKHDVLQCETVSCRCDVTDCGEGGVCCSP